jgi:hypothetical protein
MFGFANGRAPLRHFNNELLNLINMLPALAVGGLLSAGRFIGAVSRVHLAGGLRSSDSSHGLDGLLRCPAGVQRALFYTWRPLF